MNNSQTLSKENNVSLAKIKSWISNGLKITGEKVFQHLINLTSLGGLLLDFLRVHNHDQGTTQTFHWLVGDWQTFIQSNNISEASYKGIQILSTIEKN